MHGHPMQDCEFSYAENCGRSYIKATVPGAICKTILINLDHIPSLKTFGSEWQGSRADFWDTFKHVKEVLIPQTPFVDFQWQAIV